MSLGSNGKTSTWSAVNFKKNMWPRWAVNLSPRCGHMIPVSGYLVMTGVNWSPHGCLISFLLHSKLRLYVSVNLFWSMVAMLRDSVVVVVCTRPRAIPLAMIIMRKSTRGFPFLSHDEYGAPLGGPSGCRSSANIPFVLLLGPCRERAVLSFTWKFATRHLDQKFCVHCSCFCGLSDVDLAGRFPALPCKS